MSLSLSLSNMRSRYAVVVFNIQHLSESERENEGRLKQVWLLETARQRAKAIREKERIIRLGKSQIEILAYF